MRYSSVVASLFVAGAICNPVADPAIDYKVKIVEITTTVVVSGNPTPESEPEFFDPEPAYIPYVYLPEDNVQSAPDFQPEQNFVPDFQPEQDFQPEEPVEIDPVPEPESEPEFETDDEPQQVSGSADGDFQARVLFHHNIHRANHSAPEIEWDESMASFAAQTAQSCIYGHDDVPGGGGYGQNIAAGVSEEEIGVVITNMFYNNELELFSQEFGKDQPSSSFSGWGHFTQIVWKDTQKVGCFVVDCSAQGLANTGATPIFTVCNYSPPGNFQGRYAENVAPPIGNAMYVA